MFTFQKLNRIVVLFLFLSVLCLPSYSGNSSGLKTDPQVLSPNRFSRFFPVVTNPNISIFGASLSPYNSNSEIQSVASADLAWTRVEIHWKTIEETYGTFDWTQAAPVDEALQAVSQAGLNPILVIEGTPAWAVKPYFSCGTIKEEYFSEFARFAQEVVKRYRSSPYNVRYYEIYNEPDAAGILGCWGDPEDVPYYGGVYYGQFLQDIYPVIKSTDPAAQVLIGGLLMDCDPVNPPIDPITGQPKNCNSTRFFEGILVSGAGSSFDGVSFHSYDYYAGPGDYNNINWYSGRTESNSSSAVPKAAYLRATMQKFGVSPKPLFDTEYALFCGEVLVNTCSSFQVDLEATKAYYVVQFTVNAIANNFKAAIWYKTMGGGRNVVLLGKDYTPLPVMNAYKFMNQEVGYAQYAGLVDHPSFMIHEFMKSGKKVWVIWTKDNLSHSLTLPELPKTIYKIGTDGNPVSISPASSILLDIEPAIIEFGQ